jgi:outer membrane protein assembly factor BamB
MQRRILFGLALSLLALKISALDWPQWQGPDRDNVSKEVGLLKDWPKDGPKRVWLYENTGLGYGGPAILKGTLYINGTRANAEQLIAIDVATGRELWSAPIASILKNGWGDGPRGTPAADGEHVYTLGGQGTLICANAKDGKVLWKKTMDELGGKIPGWGYTESVYVDDKNVYCTPGGSKGALAALNKSNGNVVWQSKDFTTGAQYSSIVPAEIAGTKQLIQRTMTDLVGVAANDGKLIWKAAFPEGRTAVIPTPVYHDGYVYITAGYGAGCKLVKINGDKAEDVYANKVMKNHHGGVVLVNGKIYGHADPGWVCQDFMTGQEVWSERKFGKGAITSADGMLYCLEEGSGTVALVEASPQGWHEHGRVTLSPQSKQRSPQGRIWTHPVVANGRLYLRDQEYLFCFDISGKNS